MAEESLLLKDRGNQSGDLDSPQTSSRCNRKALAAFFGVAVVAAAVIVFSVVLSVYSGKSALLDKFRRSSFSVSFDEAFNGKYSPQRYSTVWIDDDKYLAFNSHTQTMDVIDLTNNSSRPLLVPEDYGTVLGHSHWLTSDAKYIMFANNTKQQYRYSFFADYYVYNTETRQIDPIKPPNEDFSEQIAYAAWNSKVNSLIFVYKNDIYYMASPVAEAQRLTTSGEKNKIYNGIPDWVYQEEILNSDNTIWFSPDGRYLCYAEIDDTNVPWYEFSWYGDIQNNYTKIRKIPYPKAGYPNPTVKVKVVDLSTLPSPAGKAVSAGILHVPNEFQSKDHYITTVAWGTGGIVTVTWLNREQNKSIMSLCRKTTTWVCAEASPVTVTDGWVDDKYPKPLFSANGTYFLTVMAFPSESKGEFLHLTQMDLSKTPPEPKQLTFGAWEVEDLLVFDDEREIVFFTSTEVSPMERHIYSYSLNEDEKTCLTCDLPETKAGKCKYYSASFSTKGSWYNLACSGPDIPRYTLRSTKNDKVIVLQNNDELRNKLQGVGALPTVATYEVTSEGGNTIHVKEVRPPNFNTNKKYAVLFSVYGGPATQKVIETWSPLDWENGYLVTNFDVILVTLDARGTKGRGESFKHAVYKHFGKYEARDTIEVGRYLQRQSYVDKDKIAIWGWSFGGFLTSYVLGKDKGETFMVGMAVAPVTDWRYYDSIYTERYMMQPKDNPDGYKESSVLRLAENFKDDSYLLVHGTGDDNVHFQNTAQMVKALTKAEVKYRVQFYTDQSHGLNGDGANSHVYHLLEEFLVEHLGLQES